MKKFLSWMLILLLTVQPAFADSVTLTSGTSWTIPGGVKAGTVITIGGWGGGGASSSGASFGAGGAGGAYAADTYTVTSTDISNGFIPYTIGTGGAGTVASLPAGGGDTTFGTFTNLIGNTTNEGAATGSPGTLPTGYTTALSGLTQTVVGFGTDTSLGPSYPYIDINFSGTTTGTSITFGPPNVSCLPSTAYTGSVYIGLEANTGGTLPTSWVLQMAENTWFAYSTGANGSTTVPTGTLQHYTVTANPVGATIHSVGMYLTMTVVTSTAYNFTLRFAAWQVNTGATAGTFQPTPGTYTQALGGSPPNGTAGGVGPRWNSVTGVGRTHYYNGGAGAAYNVNGSGGGGAAGPAGVGAAGSTAGVGGTGDNGSGGTGGAVSTTSPGNAGTANANGGGGGGGLKTNTGTGGAGGAPGGGGGAAVVATGTGGGGGLGQLILTWTPVATAGSSLMTTGAGN